MRTLLLVSLALALSGGPSLLSAATTGSVDGTLKDPSGAVVPGATVTITNKAQGVETKVQLPIEGRLHFPQPACGTYDLKTEAGGFKPQTKPGIAVDLDAVLHFDLTLELAEKATQIDVNESGVQIDTESTQVGQVVSSSGDDCGRAERPELHRSARSSAGNRTHVHAAADSVVMAGATVADQPFRHDQSRQPIHLRPA